MSKVAALFRKLKENRWTQAAILLTALTPAVWIFCNLRLTAFLSTMHRIVWWTVPVIFVIVLAAIFLQGIRWWMLMRIFIPGIKLGEVLSCHFIGVFYAIALPGPSQDLIRATMISRSYDYSYAWAATWLSRFFGMIVIMILSLYGFITSPPEIIPTGAKQGMAVIFCALIIIGYASFSKRFTRPIRDLTSRWIPRKALSIIENIRDSVYKYKYHRGQLALFFVVTFLAQFLVILAYSVMIKSFSGHYHLSEVLALMPLVEVIAASVPFAPQGLGVREVFLAMVFKQMHLSTEQLGAYVVLLYSYSIATKLTGAVPLALRAFRFGRQSFAKSSPRSDRSNDTGPDPIREITD